MITAFLKTQNTNFDVAHIINKILTCKDIQSKIYTKQLVPGSKFKKGKLSKNKLKLNIGIITYRFDVTEIKVL